MSHMIFIHVAYIGFWVGSISNIQLAQGKECDFTRQIHFVELHKYFGADFVCLHNMVKQSEKEWEQA